MPFAFLLSHEDWEPAWEPIGSNRHQLEFKRNTAGKFLFRLSVDNRLKEVLYTS